MIQALIALVFVFFIPGYLLINALYPRKGEFDPEYDTLYRVTLGIVMSVAITIFVGFGLNYLGINPETGLGYFQGPYIWVILIILTILFFFIGFFRGAYPFMGRISPKLHRLPPRDEKSTLIYRKEDSQKVVKLQELAAKRERLKIKLGEYEKKMKIYTGEEKNTIDNKKRRIQRELSALDKEIRKLEDEIMGEIV